MIYASVAVIIVVILSVFFLLFFFFGKKRELPLFKDKGQSGEYIIARILGKTVRGKQYVINDLLLDLGNGKSCQIDHIFINTYGIWVIETKNYAGTICGNDDLREWTQILGNGNTINKFYNPVKQNAGHIYNLSKLLKARDVFHNIVVFLPKADISLVDSDNVYGIDEFSELITKRTGVTLSLEEMEYCYNTLLALQRERGLSQKKHIQNIHKMQKNLKKGICPRCGGKLLLRHGQYGDFYYCSGYPKCKFTMSADSRNGV